MVPCTRIIWEKVESKHGYGHASSSNYEWKYRKCAKKSTRYFRVEYVYLNRSSNNEDKKFDVFALCEKCAAEATTNKNKFWFPKEHHKHPYGGTHWMDGSPVYQLRGKIGSIAEVQGTESMFRNDLKDRKRSALKASIARIMHQDCYKQISPDDWQQVFTDLYEEFVVESVLHS